MSIEKKAFEAYNKNRELKPKYHIPESCWIDWFTAGYKQAIEDQSQNIEIKGCEYCHSMDDDVLCALSFGEKDDFHGLEISDCTLRVYDVTGIETIIDIDYCPKCGRRLNTEGQ